MKNKIRERISMKNFLMSSMKGFLVLLGFIILCAIPITCTAVMNSVLGEVKTDIILLITALLLLWIGLSWIFYIQKKDK